LIAGLRESAIALPSLGRSNLLAAFSDHWVGRCGKSFTVELHTERRGGASAPPRWLREQAKKLGVRSQELEARNRVSILDSNS
jgi:hypothetical protein